MKSFKQVIDHVLMLLLPVLMAEMLTGQELHEWLGLVMGALFILHHLLNIGWYRALPKGKYGPYRALLTGVDVLLLVTMFALVGSGIAMSGYALPGLFRGGRMAARRLHLFISHWGLILMAFHLGLHWQPALDALHLDKKAPAWTVVLRVLAAIWAAFGVYALIAQHVPDYLLLRAVFLQVGDHQTPLTLFIGYLGVMGLFTAVGHYLAKLAKRSHVNCPKPLVFLIPVALCVLAAVAFSLGGWTGGGQPNGGGNGWGGQYNGNGWGGQQEDHQGGKQQGQQPQAPAAEVDDGFILISGGSFQMGSPADEGWRGDDETLHTVTVSDFYMSPYEVTQAEYTALMDGNPSIFSGDELPVETVSWLDAVAYCNARSKAEGLTPAYSVNGGIVTWDRSADGYRLPTEAEWEYACRAGTSMPFNTETSIGADECNFYGHYPYHIEENYFSQGNLTTKPGQYRQTTVAVDSFKPNGFGLYNMHGNVSEWVWDTYGAYDVSAVEDPTGPETGTRKVYRGGGWNDFAKNMRSAYRAALEQDAASFNLGIRLVRNAAAGTGMVTSSQTERNTNTGGKMLIAYFSWGGNTRGVAREIQRQTGADIFEIVPIPAYSDDYNTVLDEAQRDQSIQARPEIADLPANMDEYDIIMLGYPNWWASIPMPIASFLEAYDFTGKIILPFCSHGGGRFGQSLTAIAKLAPDAVLGEGLSVHYSGGSALPQDVTDWLKKNGIT